MTMKWIKIGVLSLTLAVSAHAQSSFSSFWLKFKAAVTRGDKAAVANMTKLPFSLGYDPGTDSEAFLRTRKGFLGKYKYIFNNEVNAVKCFAAAAPEKEKRSYIITCGFKNEPADNDKPFVYSFTQTKQGWRFDGFENVNE